MFHWREFELLQFLFVKYTHELTCLFQLILSENCYINALWRSRLDNRLACMRFGVQTPVPTQFSIYYCESGSNISLIVLVHTFFEMKKPEKLNIHIKQISLNNSLDLF